MVIAFVAFFLPPVIGALIAAQIARHVRFRWLLLVLAVILSTTFVILFLAMPFTGVSSELAVGAAASVALIPAHLVVFLGKLDQPKPVLMLVVLACVVAVVMPFTGRVHFAQRVAWDCNGTVSSKYRSRNHRAPTITVRTPSGSQTLEFIEESAWQRIDVGDTLVKHEGSVYGEVNGERIRLVPSAMPWWNEPG